MWAVRAVAAIVVLTAAVSVMGCSETPKQDLAMLEGDTWVLTEMRSDAGALKASETDVRTTVRFTDGEIAGSGGVNQYGGTYEAAADGGMTIKPGASTLMAGPQPAMDQEARFFALLPQVRSFVVSAGTLELRDDVGATLLRFAAVVPAPLVGTTWLCGSVNNGAGGVVSTVADARLTAVFDDAGKVTGSAGVNQYSGTFRVSGDVLTVGPLASTRRAGSAALMEQEGQYLKALEAAKRFAIEGDSLTVYGSTGEALLTYAAE